MTPWRGSSSHYTVYHKAPLFPRALFDCHSCFIQENPEENQAHRLCRRHHCPVLGMQGPRYSDESGGLPGGAGGLTASLQPEPQRKQDAGASFQQLCVHAQIPEEAHPPQVLLNI